MTITWHTVVYALAGWGGFDLLLRLLLRVPLLASIGDVWRRWRK